MDHRIATFLSAARHKNYTRAAEELHITQPAVSQHIRYLEKKYGCALFTQKGKKIEITPEGEILRQTMLRIQNDELAMEVRMRELRSEHKNITFGVTKTIGEYAIIEPLSRYVKAHPEINISMKSGNTTDLLEMMENGEIECALMEGYFDEERYDHVLYSKERFVPVCSAKHEFQHKVKEMKDLLEERLIIREPGSGTRNILERDLSVKGLTVEDFGKRLEVGHMHAVIGLMERDCGISFLYRIAVEENLAAGTLREIRLNDFKVSHNFEFVWQKGSVFGDDYRQFCRELKKSE